MNLLLVLTCPKRAAQQGGIALLELVIVVPLILFIGLIGYDMARIFHVKKTAQSLSREIALTAYRECPSLTLIDAPVTATDPLNCLDRIRANYLTYANSQAVQPRIIVSFYRQDGLNSSCGVGEACRTSGNGIDSKSSRYGPAEIKAMFPSVPGKSSFLIAEVFLKYDSLFRFNIFDLLKAGRDSESFTPYVPEEVFLYDATIV